MRCTHLEKLFHCRIYVATHPLLVSLLSSQICVVSQRAARTRKHEKRGYRPPPLLWQPFVYILRINLPGTLVCRTDEGCSDVHIFFVPKKRLVLSYGTVLQASQLGIASRRVRSLSKGMFHSLHPTGYDAIRCSVVSKTYRVDHVLLVI